MTHPYTSLPEKAFWKPAVAERSPFDIDELWQPKFAVNPADSVVTFGSCFAQHIGRALSARGYNWLITEQAPGTLPADRIKDFNYEVFSCRTGNIYTASLLEQWVDWAMGNRHIPNEVWEQDGRYIDPFRPRIEPNGFETADELMCARRETLRYFKLAIKRANVFVFTLGLTESWFNVPGQHRAGKRYEYPMCPGTVGGTFTDEQHKFVNQSFEEVRKSLRSAIDKMRKMNPSLKFILTISPVPLTATASGNHVLTATMESKSILRAVAGQLARNHDHIDYFPSYEIINAAPFQGMFFEADKRNVNAHGVNFVMDQFFTAQTRTFGSPTQVTPLETTRKKPTKKAKSAKAKKKAKDDVVCEEELLAAFGDKL